MTLIVFDLDGTLVDSAPEIAAAMEFAWTNVVPELPFPRDRFHIGPPLIQTVTALAPDLAPERLEAVAATFRAHYDTSDLSGTQPFAGILEAIETLAARGTKLCIATNKRNIPTQTILRRWFADRFHRVACIDSVWPDDGTRPGSKARMLEWILASTQTPVGSAVMVGDAVSDVTAAKSVGMRSIGVTWGYDALGPLTAAAPDELVHDVPALLKALQSGS